MTIISDYVVTWLTVLGMLLMPTGYGLLHLLGVAA